MSFETARFALTPVKVAWRLYRTASSGYRKHNWNGLVTTIPTSNARINDLPSQLLVLSVGRSTTTAVYGFRIAMTVVA